MFNTGNCPSVPIVANLDGNNGNNWNDGSWLWFLIVVFAIFGGWGNGFGGFGGANGGVGSEIQRGFDNQAVISKLDGIFQCSNWILQHIIFKDQSLYKPNEPYGVMVSLLKRYSVTGKKQLDDVPDVFSNFALRMTQGSRIAKVEAVHNPFRGGLY